MKRNLALTIRTFIFAFLFVLLLSVSAFAEEGLIYFSDPETNAGDTVEVTMTVQSDNTKIGDVNVLLKYPSESLEFKKGTSASGGAGTIRVHGKGTKDGDHKMNYALTFKTSNPGEYTVNIDSCEVYDENGVAITISHLGSSKITVTGDPVSSGTVRLSSLEVSPGTLSPDFSPEITYYTVTVGLSVNQLTINALPEDSNSIVNVVNNENLQEGENDITVYVQTKDGQLQNEYHIHVIKTEGGEENLQASQPASTVESTNGVQLSCKSKTITIMETGDEVTAPQGFRESQVKIDGQPVKGWIRDDGSQPEYFLIYGMNDDGELNFYRYDLSERTIQRYFPENSNTDITDSEEYILLKNSFDESESKLNFGKLILMILAIVALLMMAIVIYLSVRLSSVTKELDLLQEDRLNGVVSRHLDPDKSNRTRSDRKRTSTRDEFYDEKDDDDISDDEVDFNDSSEDNDIEATKVMPANTRRRVSRKASDIPDETTVIHRTSRRRRTRGSEYEDI